jgi:iron complex transport system substrate-binding protein
VVSAFVSGSVKKITALEPDLVIGFSDIQADLARDLIRAGLQVLIFNQRSVAEILDVILAVGRLVGAGEHAEELVQSYRARLDAARRRAAERAHRPRVYFEEWLDPTICGIRWVSELIEIAGGVDVFADRSQMPMAKDRVVSSEEVVAAAPEVYIASWCGKAFDREAALARAGFENLPAVRSGRVHEMDPAIILQPGPACLSDGLDAIEAILHLST